MMRRRGIKSFTQPYATLPDAFYTPVVPEALVEGRLLAVNEALKAQLQLPLDEAGLKALACGEAGLPDCEPLAQKYTGHQFGFYNPELGDGRGVLLGVWQDEAGQRWDLHLKGAGRTPYSRRGDGRAVLRSSIREFLASEALAGLGIPTTRALSLAVSPEAVYRERVEPRATLIRIAKTHIRFGHFEWAAAQGKTTFETLLAYVVQHHFPQYLTASVEEQAEAVLQAICTATGEMIAHWQTVGFNHGVMNTDNMAILGETFDFGPFAFMDAFQLDFVCNLSDEQGRYAFNEQPKVGLWNCQVLAESFSHLLKPEQKEQGVSAYIDAYNRQFLQVMRKKLGWSASDEPEQAQSDKQLIAELLQRLDQSRVDYLNFWLKLQAWAERQTQADREALEALFSQPKLIQPWLAAYEQRLEQGENLSAMKHSNPQFILRNHQAQAIIDAAEAGDLSLFHKWLAILQAPYNERPEFIMDQAPPAPEMQGIRLSCSS